MSTITSFTYSYNNIDNVNITKNVEYKTVYKDDNDNTWASSYNNTISNDDMKESFNKIFKNNKIIKEQIGNSENKKDWKIKEFDNHSFTKEYNENYKKYPYYEYYLEDKLHNINIHNNIDIEKEDDDKKKSQLALEN